MTDDGKIQCEFPGCQARAKPGMGMKGHVTRAHPKTSVDSEEAFKRVAAAIEVLFPAGIPAIRAIEVGDLFKTMLKVVIRE